MWDEMQEMKSRIWDRNARMNARNVEKKWDKMQEHGKKYKKKRMWDERQEM